MFDKWMDEHRDIRFCMIFCRSAFESRLFSSDSKPVLYLFTILVQAVINLTNVIFAASMERIISHDRFLTSTMSRYAPHGRSSNQPRATSSTVCQKCLGSGRHIHLLAVDMRLYLQ